MRLLLLDEHYMDSITVVPVQSQTSCENLVTYLREFALLDQFLSSHYQTLFFV